jgi:hypothetical protein
VSQRDERTLGLIFAKLGASETFDALRSDGLDHYERVWYRGYFSE